MVNYDDFLKVFKRSSTVAYIPTGYQWPNVSKLIQNQWAYIAQWLIELIANAIDATSPKQTIWRFWEWFYQSLKFINDGEGEIIVTTKKDGTKWFSINLINKSWVIQVGSVWIEKQASGTKIELKKMLSKDDQASLKQFVVNSFKANRKVKIILNNWEINDLSSYLSYKGESPTSAIESIHVEINENWFSITDNGIGMSSQELAEKLLYPNLSSKERINPESMSEADMNFIVSNETAFYYKKYLTQNRSIKKYNQKNRWKTTIRLQVSWILIEEFESNTSYDISEFCLDLPGFTWLPESRNTIELTKEVVISLKEVIHKIISQGENKKEQFVLLEIIWKIISHLKSRDISNSSIESKYDITKVAKRAFKELKERIESKGTIVIPSIEWIQNVLWERIDVVYVDPEFLSFDIKRIPWIKKLESVVGATREFYEIEFHTNAEYDYLILPDTIIVNSLYLRDQESIDIINTQINLNTNYEQWNDRVFYWTIDSLKHSHYKNVLAAVKIWDWFTEKCEQIDIVDPSEVISIPKKLDDILSVIIDQKTIKMHPKEKVQEYIERILNVVDIYDGMLDNVKKYAEGIQESEYTLPEDVHIPDVHMPYNLFVYFIFLNEYRGNIWWNRSYSLSEIFLQKFIDFIRHYSEEVIWLFYMAESCFFEAKNIETYLSRTIDLLSNENSFTYAKRYIEEMDEYINIDILAYISTMEECPFKIHHEDFIFFFWQADIWTIEIEWNTEYCVEYEDESLIFNWSEFLTINWEYVFWRIFQESCINGKTCFSYRTLEDDDTTYLFYANQVYKCIFPMEDAENYYVETDETGVYVGYYYVPYSSLDSGLQKVYCIEEDETRTEVQIEILIPQDTRVSRTPILDTKDFDLKRDISEDVRFFIEFLCLWWEFLWRQQDQIIFDTWGHLLLTDVIGISRNFPEEFVNINWSNGINILKHLTESIQEKLKNRIPFQRNITTTIEWQDRSSMIWLREVIQNSRDAILSSQYNDTSVKNVIRVDFYQWDDHWVSRISDPVGMRLSDVFTYLLTPWKSWKERDELATGMFGQGFYSLAIWSKEIRVKTGSGDKKTTYIRLTPIYNTNADIIDFRIDYSLQDEQFKWTIIERVDSNEWIWGNIWALMGIQNLKKYVWNLDDMEILYNWNKILSPENTILLETEDIPSLWILSLKRNNDQYERLTKDNLFISDIKDVYLSHFPDWIKDYIRNNNYSLDLPGKIELTKTRNAIIDTEKNIEILKPYIFNIFCRQIIKDYLSWRVKIPMMPLDYYWLDYYEYQFNTTILEYTDRLNHGWVLNASEIEILKDKNLMIQFLINLKVVNAWEYINIRWLKKERDNKKKIQKHTQNSYLINHKAKERNSRKESVYIENDAEKVEFLKKMKDKFNPIIQRIFGFDIEFWFLSWIWWDACSWNWEISFNAKNFESIKNYKNVDLIEIVTHEMAHFVERFIKELGIDFEEEIVKNQKTLRTLVGSQVPNEWNHETFGTHQKDLEHEHSFERIQRQILKIMTREYLNCTQPPSDVQ